MYILNKHTKFSGNSAYNDEGGFIAHVPLLIYPVVGEMYNIV